MSDGELILLAVLSEDKPTFDFSLPLNQQVTQPLVKNIASYL